jgi:hypothetical protein
MLREFRLNPSEVISLFLGYCMRRKCTESGDTSVTTGYVICGNCHFLVCSEGTEGGVELKLYSSLTLALGGLCGHRNASAALPTVPITEVLTWGPGLDWAGS